jgi:hypothetical protein
VVSIGDLDEEMPTAAGLPLLLGGALGLDGYTGGVGRDAEGLGQSLDPRRLYDRGAHRSAELFEPPRHGAAIERDAVAAKAGLETVKRHAPPKLLVDDVAEHRGRGQCTRQDLLWDGSRLKHGIIVEGLVFGAGDDDPALAAALPGELAALFEVHSCGLALLDQFFVDRVGGVAPGKPDISARQVDLSVLHG